ncbi:MAG: glycosyltransferase [Candidatus Omnitrophica bacterium]|nr:glycosyltransferase [Candidatus Omnitrophota bacterium]
MSDQVDFSVVIPALNEEGTVGICVDKALGSFKASGRNGEVIVVDNGSTDRTVEVAEEAGARVVKESRKGYGSALKRGIAEARGKYIIMGDADDTYDFSKIRPFMKKLEKGVDLVMGSRLGGRINPDAMPPLHRYIGNPVLTGILNIFFRGRISDAHCGLRGFSKDAVNSLNLRSDGMEFASEMIIKALNDRLNIEQIPIEYHSSPVERKPHLRSFRDGWRHLRFMLIYSPEYLFLVPGAVLFLTGAALLVMVTIKSFYVSSIQLGLSTMIFSHGSVFLGLQLMLLGISAKIKGCAEGMIPQDAVVKFVKEKFRLEKGLQAGFAVMLAGLALGGFTVWKLYLQQSSLTVNIGLTKLAIISVTVILLGLQLMAASFYLSLADIDRTLE